MLPSGCRSYGGQQCIKRRHEYGFLSQIVAGDEAWGHHFEPESKRQSKQWKRPIPPPKKSNAVYTSSGKSVVVSNATYLTKSDRGPRNSSWQGARSTPVVGLEHHTDFTKECLNRIISDRKELELRAERDRENQRIFELQKLQLITDTSTTADSNMPKLELHKLLPIFDPKTTDVTIFLDLFERQLTFLKVPVPQWVVYLVGLLPTEVSNLIAKESVVDAQDYYKVKQILLKRFKLSAEKFRQMFSRHSKDPVKTWRDFYFDLQTYFDGWLKESKVTTLEELKDLIVADQIKKKTPQDYKDHFLDQWCNWNNPLQLVDKLDSYEEVKNMRNKNNKNFSRKRKEMNSSPWRSNYTQNPKLSYQHSLSGFPSQSRRETGIPSNSRRNPISKDRIPEKKIVDTKEDRTPVSCYGSGAPGIIRSRCHTCNPVRQKDDALSSSLNQSNFYSFSSESNPISIIQISICNTEAAVCADTGATHSVAGEKLYHLLKQKGLNFEEKTMQMTLADGRTQTTEILTTSVDISIQGKIIPTELLILKNARGNRTLLGIDFLTAAGIVLDLQRKQWYFTETSHRKYNFVKAPPNINALLTVDPDPHLCQLRKNEGTHLSLPQREELNSLLEKYEECFQPGGEPTPFIEHRIQSFNLKVQYIPGKANVVADMLSRPVTQEEESFCEENNITIADMPTRSCKDMREAQLKDDNLKKIIDSFESSLKTEDYANWTERGFLMNQGVLYRYVPDADSAEAQLVIPTAERELIMERDHNDPMAGHYGEEGTFQKIARRYYWTGMRKYISDYIKKCPECARFKATNQKPAGLLRTPVYSQRFEVIAIDLFGPLPQTDTGKQWIFIVEDCTTKWVELFALSQASARQCATTLIEEVFMRHGIPRRIISDNGTQFVSAVLQQICFTLNI
ncbi:retrovirus-related Pol polyprotein from transposon 412 [Trichonephila clavipes]|nr:retrovirus-related Pol polyprotein from transposon 412 [Trichonephila clavipes]